MEVAEDNAASSRAPPHGEEAGAASSLAPPQGEEAGAASSLAPPQGEEAGAASSLAPPEDQIFALGPRLLEAQRRCVWVRLRWLISGDPIEGIFQMDSLDRFCQDLDEGNIPGVPTTRCDPDYECDLDWHGHYELRWGDRLLDEIRDQYLEDFGMPDFTELSLVYAADAPAAEGE